MLRKTPPSLHHPPHQDWFSSPVSSQHGPRGFPDLSGTQPGGSHQIWTLRRPAHAQRSWSLDVLRREWSPVWRMSQSLACGKFVLKLGIGFCLCTVYCFLRMEVQRHVQCNLYIYMYHMYFGSRIKRLEKVRFPFRRYAAYGSSVIASNFAD